MIKRNLMGPNIKIAIVGYSGSGKSEFVEESNLLVLNKLERLLTVCKVKNIDDIDLSKEFYFIGKTDEEISLVCETNDVPENTIEREDGWRGFRIQ